MGTKCLPVDKNCYGKATHNNNPIGTKRIGTNLPCRSSENQYRGLLEVDKQACGGEEENEDPSTSGNHFMHG